MNGAIAILTAWAVLGAESSRPRFYGDEELNGTEVIWGSECVLPDGSGLAFGGCDPADDKGPARTRVREGDRWKPIAEDLRRRNPLQPLHERAAALAARAKRTGTKARWLYLEGFPPAEEEKEWKAGGFRDLEGLLEKAAALAADLDAARGLEPPEAAEARRAAELVRSAVGEMEAAARSTPGLFLEPVQALARAQVDLERAAELLDAEPLPRALSPIFHDGKTGLYVLFGGDHLDFLMNDTWVFDPVKVRWERRHPLVAPRPRANHRLEAHGGGRVVLAGGYTYTSSTDYCGGQYRDIGDGDWVYDIASDAWSIAPTHADLADRRQYRKGPFDPAFFLGGVRPDRAAFEERLRAIPVNSWAVLRPSRIPRQNRDWGTAIIDPSRDLILYWSGGHSAHGGSDVLHLHLATGRWELTFPVEFPLGQLYANTAYPGGYNLNSRPWPTGHTYLSYAMLGERMVFVGHRRHAYLYDPGLADWVGREEKPEGMTYSDCFYDLNCCATPGGVICWTKEGRLFRRGDRDPPGSWVELKLSGKIPGSSVDFSVMVHDSKRGRLLLFRTDYGKSYDGEVHEVNLETVTARRLSPGNAGAVAAAGAAGTAGAAGSGGPFGIDRACYHPGADLVLFGTLLPPGPDGFRRTPAYDPAGNRWVSLRLAYEVSGEGEGKEPRTPRGHSSGIVHDARRSLVWGVDAACEVYALRVDAAKADIRPLEPVGR